MSCFHFIVEELIAQPFLDVSTFGAAFPGLEFASWGPFDQEKVSTNELLTVGCRCVYV
eukprot:m.161778 g.161778  ORF g.161778 m.161778 type:complete len:58 (+) comp24864_c0_seq4:2854-3027(+)